MHYLLMYKTASDYLARRADFRAGHLAYAWDAVERGELLLGGAMGDPIDGAMLLFSADSPAIPSAFAKNDPYVINGLVESWVVKPWSTVVGRDATSPIRERR